MAVLDLYPQYYETISKVSGSRLYSIPCITKFTPSGDNYYFLCEYPEKISKFWENQKKKLEHRKIIKIDMSDKQFLIPQEPILIAHSIINYIDKNYPDLFKMEISQDEKTIEILIDWEEE